MCWWLWYNLKSINYEKLLNFPSIRQKNMWRMTEKMLMKKEKKVFHMCCPWKMKTIHNMFCESKHNPLNIWCIKALYWCKLKLMWKKLFTAENETNEQNDRFLNKPTAVYSCVCLCDHSFYTILKSFTFISLLTILFMLSWKILLLNLNAPKIYFSSPHYFVSKWPLKFYKISD